MPNTLNKNSDKKEPKKRGPKFRVGDSKPAIEGSDYVRYRCARTITRPTLIRWLQTFCDEKDIKAGDAIHILAMDRLRDLYGTPPNTIQLILEAAQRMQKEQK